ncbi:MAG: site-specific tyrosine recombinase XerC [Leptospiraceae bacterium]|nr:site-specific tyrosine recombinase XerC [Leptospiraceae bacterium]MCB1314558.1 site-specific tyrosine recombinase XerC [Leptospiraceae bacterium]MCB1320067.1 site-specific tyrosine recombinase XerC [Leptospiraceae bacterium]
MSEISTGPDFFKDPKMRWSTIVELANRYFEWLEERAFSKNTINNRQNYLSYFLAWLAERGIYEPAEVTRPIIERYQRYMYHYRKKDGNALSFRSQSMRLVAIRMYFKWLAQQHYILHNPASEIILPKYEKRLPKHVLNTKEAEAIMGQPDINEPLGLRDRAMLETLYSTGIRRTELSNLKLYDLDFDNGTLMVRQGKGRKDRMIPIGDRALHWIERYLHEVRPALARWPDEGVIFLANNGKAITPHTLTGLVRAYVITSGVNKIGACHLFRHTMATLLLENGADIRFIQAMLGHASAETTQIYTQVSIRQLKKVHEQFHPAKLPEKLQRQKSLLLNAEAEQEIQPREVSKRDAARYKYTPSGRDTNFSSEQIGRGPAHPQAGGAP